MTDRQSPAVAYTAMPTDVVLQEVVLRDGLQIEPIFVSTADKIALADALSAAGFTRIEVTSFVSPRAVPALADAADVMRGIVRRPGVVYTALVPNVRGAANAIAAGADELNMVASASTTHNQANMRMTTEASLKSFADIANSVAGTAVLLNGTVATAFGCPFEGDQPEEHILRMVDRYLDLGCSGITLADTTGMADPRQVTRLVARVLERVTPAQLTLHFHNTRGLGIANLLAAHAAGARRFDAALGGLGGCPFAPGASGNICTEDVAAMCARMGLSTGIDLESLIALSRQLPRLVGHDVPGQIMKAGRVEDLHSAPA